MRDRKAKKLTASAKAQPDKICAAKQQRAALLSGTRKFAAPSPPSECQRGTGSVPLFGLALEAAAERAGISVRTLQRFNLTGEGPPYVCVGKRRVLYPLDELDKWLRSRLVRNSAEAGRLRNIQCQARP